jgi:2-methylcitrate dehydratase PrpD
MVGATANSTQAADLTRLLAGWASALGYQDLPAPVSELAKQCLLDYLSVALAGAGDPLVQILFDEMAGAGGTPEATIIGYSARLPVLSAALVNGAMAHALDYDDVNMAMPGHPSVAILPGLLALAEQKGSSGSEVITAFVAGYEIACRIGAALRPGHYNLGFHSTGTIGTFGATAACARLLGLDAEATAKGGTERAARGAPRPAGVFEPHRHR